MVCLCQVILYRHYLFDFAWRYETATPRTHVGRALLPLSYPAVFCVTLMYCIFMQALSLQPQFNVQTYALINYIYTKHERFQVVH